jgi:hypothetical protein
LRHPTQGWSSFYPYDAERSSPEFADFLLQIAKHYSTADTIHLVVDNMSTHTRKALVERFGQKADE